MHLKPSHLISAVLPLCLLAAMLAGCRVNISVGSGSYITGEDYPDARKYKTGAFTYAADEVKAVEVYWRSGEIALIESGASELSVSESGGELPEDTALHYLLDGGVLRIRFCGSGARILVNEADKRLRLEVPKGIDISVHTTSALLKADALEQGNILISAFSGRTELGTVTAENIDLSSSSGAIRAGSIAEEITAGLMNIEKAAAMDIYFDNEPGFVLGIMLILISLLCHYGAELRESRDIPAE